jgi:hypothetical protein
MSANSKTSEPQPLNAILRIKCSCGKWNNIKVEKIMFQLDNEEPKMQVLVPAYLPIKTQVCKKCKKEIANPKEVIRIIKS